MQSFQHTLTVVARARDLDRIRRALASHADPSGRPASNTAETRALFEGEDLAIHFGRAFLIDEPAGSEFDSWLVLESNFDSPEAERGRAVGRHLEALASARASALGDLFAGCEGFEGRPLAEALGDAVAPSTAEYQGHVGRDLERIRLEASVHDEAMRVVSAAPCGLSAGEIHAAVRAGVRAAAQEPGSPLGGLDLDGAAPDFPDPEERAKKLDRPVLPWAENALRLFGGDSAVIGAPIALLTAPITAPWLAYAALRAAAGPEFDTQREAEAQSAAGKKQLALNQQAEDHIMQNALSHVVPLRRGLAGSLTLRFFHRYLSLLARRYFNYVELLGGIPSIHFAKWLLIDKGRRLLFLSNYDGSWESYLGDFVDQAALGLNLAWCLTEGYPKTYGFQWGGARDEERFKAWARARQVPTPVFYSAYPDLTLSVINNNTWLRHGLHAGSKVDDGWVRRLT